jgi:hypothetical protein
VVLDILKCKSTGAEVADYPELKDDPLFSKPPCAAG